ncbi:BRO family protein [Leuconostoc mesenteroides]|uniref:BRO family, N-terminal domain protein n=1 Tax=Leuconostoc mesenteroides subsp. cremoris ATCC 19254 TaxID=586220 RepID=C2KJE7_LEUMC|nr:BRO family protein [Leuconostoc mesenteroides]EEJ42684.1 BRO family, N-terminal domain protein [Leuconostoc mesenteroides subsp. cremoris ATCC 19254]MDG9749569.1 BRO family protein [Leuconostoc mesenteroides]GEP15695.1 antirepressor [Leuconostoc mesenteroides subsp. cremoris]
MQNEVQVFNFETSRVRTLNLEDVIWFVGKDVADTLGYSASRNALSKHVDNDDKLTHQISASGQKREMTLINESGLYSLILSSKQPNAKKFKRWVTSEVLPTIRQTGGYQLAPKDPMQVLELMFQSLKMQDYRQERLERKINSIQDSQTISGDQELVLRQIRNEKAVQILGYKGNARYQALSRMVFARISKEFKSKFSIPRYNALLAKDFEKAKRYLMKWEPDDAFAYRIAYRKGVKK